ncbi:MAG: hypothetical protein IJ864_05505 [Alphaproteobacteria bacterium]|nr:hypothetical protein [Alphaproteobacteria bacterium]
MVWILAAIVVIAIYNAERLPELFSKFRNEVPHMVETGKKVSKELKEKAQAVAKEKTASRKRNDKN